MSDLIRREDVYDVLKKAIIAEMPIYVFDKLWNGIRDLPSVEPERKWIPVTERLPEDDTDVLVQFSNNMTVGYYKCSRWRIATGADLYCPIEDHEEKPISWMPLPEPWRGE